MKDNEYEVVGRGIIETLVSRLAAVVGFAAITVERLLVLAILICMPIGIVILIAGAIAVPIYLLGEFLSRFGEWAKPATYMAFGFPAAYWYGGYVVKVFYTTTGEFNKALGNGFRLKN